MFWIGVGVGLGEHGWVNLVGLGWIGLRVGRAGYGGKVGWGRLGTAAGEGQLVSKKRGKVALG